MGNTPLDPVIAAKLFGGSGGFGSVTSVNGKTGVVVLDPEDVGAAPAETTETVTGTTPTIEPQANTIYNCGELTSLTISSIPATGEFSIVFVSGSTATVLTVPQTMTMPDNFAVEASTRYEINVKDGYAVVGSWAVTP